MSRSQLVWTPSGWEPPPAPGREKLNSGRRDLQMGACWAWRKWGALSAGLCISWMGSGLASGASLRVFPLGQGELGPFGGPRSFLLTSSALCSQVPVTCSAWVF